MTPLIWIAAATVSLSSGMLVYLLAAVPDTRRRALANLKRGTAEISAKPRIGQASAADLRARVVQAMPKGATAYLERLVIRAGRPAAWPVERVLVMKFVLGAVALVLALLVISMLRTPQSIGVGILVSLVAFFVPDLRLYSIGTERSTAIGHELPDMLDQMSIAVEAGLGFDAAMVRVARNGKGPLAQEMIRALQDIQVGQPRRAAYLDLGERCGVPALQRFMRSIVQAETYGLAMATVLQTQAKEMRLARRQRAEEHAMKIPVKVTFPLVLCIMPSLLIVLLGPAVIKIIEQFSGGL